MLPAAYSQESPCAAVNTAGSMQSTDRQMSAEQKKVLREGLKLRKKYPLEVMVTNSKVVALGQQQVGTIGWCGGNLSWIFCMSQPISVDGGNRIVLEIQIRGERYHQGSCPSGLFEKCANLASGVYPASLGTRWDSPRRLRVLANVGGKLQKVTFLLQ